MKVRSKIPERIVNKVNKTEGVLNYDYDNNYPGRVTDIVNSSGMAVKCIDLSGRFTEGKGFSNLEFYKKIINSKGLTNDKLLRSVSKDLANRNGFAVHINYNALYQKLELRPIPFTDCRLADPDGEHKGKIGVYNNWNKKNGQFKRSEIQWIDIYNPDENVIQSQVEASIPDKGTIEDGWAAYKGQILWFSTEGEGTYPLAPYDSVLFDIETDGRVKSHTRKKAATGWNADMVIIEYSDEEEGEDEQQAINELYERVQGDEGAGNIIRLSLKTGSTPPVFQKIDKSSDKEDYYSINEKRVQDNIRKVFGFPSVLVGSDVQGSLGLVNAIEEACNYVNGLYDRERRIMEETFQTLFFNWHEPINQSNDYSIIPLTLVESKIVPINPPAA